MKKNTKGFTLIELLAVLVILGIITTIAVQAYNMLIVRNDQSKYNYYKSFVEKGADIYLDARKISMISGECLSVDYQTLVDKNLVKEEDITCTGNLILRKEGNKYIYDDTNLECKTKSEKVVKEKGEVQAVCDVTQAFTFDNNYIRTSEVAQEMNADTDKWIDVSTAHTVVSAFDLAGAKQLSFSACAGECGIYQDVVEPLIYGKNYTWSVYLKANNTHKFKIGIGSGTIEVQATGTWQKVSHTFEATKEDAGTTKFAIISTTGWTDTDDDLYIHSVSVLKESKSLKQKIAKVVGESFKSLPEVTRKGYNFLGWFTEPTGGVQITEESIVPNTKNVTYYAHWKEKSIKVNYLANEGNGTMASDTINYGSEYTIKNNTFTKEAYLFDYWNDNDNNKNFNIWPFTPIPWNYAKDINLSVIWKPAQFTVTFDANGGNVDITDKIVTYTLEYGDLPIPTREGHTFKGWYTQTSGGTKISDTTEVTMQFDHTLYARWSINSYIVTINSGEGISNVTGSGTYEYGANVTIGATLASNSVWINWTGHETLTTKEYTFTMPAQNVNFTANAHQHKGTSGSSSANGCYTVRTSAGKTCPGHKLQYWQCGWCGHTFGPSVNPPSNCDLAGTTSHVDTPKWNGAGSAGTTYCSGCKTKYVYTLGCGY